MKVKLLTSLVLIGTILVSGCAAPKPPPTLSIPSSAAGDISNPKLVLASCYKMEGFTITLASPTYSLPLALEEIGNLQHIQSLFRLEGNQEELLQRNGFVVIPWHGDDIVAPYRTMKEWEVPIFITSDTLLHLYHIQFNETLKRIEEDEFFNQLIDMSQAMLETAIEDYESFTNPDLKEAARRNVAYFAVGLKLFQTPTDGYDEVRIKQRLSSGTVNTHMIKRNSSR